MTRILVASMIILALLCSLSAAGQIGFEEDFALAKDRAVPLAQLIPGTEDYYFYHCINYQNTGQFDKVDELLKLWIERYNRTSRVVEIENRQALLKYDQNPAATLTYLQRNLGLTFSHQREVLGQKPTLGTALDANVIRRDAFMNRAFSMNPRTLNGFEDSAIEWYIREPLNDDVRRSLLGRLQRPDYPNMAKIVVDDLNYRFSSGFGSFPIHAQLLLSQLEECARLKPELLNQGNFVNAYLSKLQPNPDVDWSHNAAEREAYYDRLWAFVSKLDPVHNSLKACVLYNRLAHDRAAGVWDKPRFMEYLKLPRQAGYISPLFSKRINDNRMPLADLNASYENVARIAPVGVDEPLVRSYLAHFFLAEDSTAEYEPYVRDDYLRHLFAETKIVNGIGDMEKWYSLLRDDPAYLQTLKERVDLDFLETNKEVFSPDDPVALDLYVKNVPKLIRKVFEINTMNFYRDRMEEINTDVNLDGLIANEEKVFSYNDVSLRRVKRHFDDFPALKARGVYIVEFIGNGMSSRALIRKGQLHPLVRTTSAGQSFTILDEANRKVPGATLTLGGREYLSGKDGAITVPFSNKPGQETIILRLGDFASLGSFSHESEAYTLATGIYVDREALLKRRKAQVLVRTQLYLNGTPVSLSVLENPTLVITSVDSEGVSTSKEVADFKLFEDRESAYEFQVPENLVRLTFLLKAKVQNLSQNVKQDLASTQAFALNGIDASDKTEDLHLRHVDGKYFLDVLGKTGEPLADRPVQLAFKHIDFKNEINATLQSAKDGGVALGELAGIQWVRATGPQGTGQTWYLLKDLHTYPQSVHASEGETFSLPYMGSLQKAEPTEISLIEKRGSTFVRDMFEMVSVKDGFIVVSGLPRGDYDLLIKPADAHIAVRVTKGALSDGYLMGESRQLEVTNAAALQIVSIESDKDNVKIRLANATKFARVHVVATRFMPEYSIASELGRIGFPGPSMTTLEKPESVYVAGRNIGDEFRYILDRKYAMKLPGNMLTRPALLLNPWAIRKTETATHGAQAGGEYGDGQGYGGTFGLKGKGWDGQLKQRPGGPEAFSADLDFLAEPSVVIKNMEPDAQGVVTIPRKLLGAHSQLHVVAVDPVNTVYRETTLSDVEASFLDLRLVKGLDPAKHYTEQKLITALKAGDKFRIADVTTSKFEVYDTVARMYALYGTLSNDPNLVEFGFILQWPKLTDAQKQEKYSKYACHELNYFLARKDPAFFQKVVQPYLKNKKDKTFIDDYLLANDLSGYLRPWSYERLNVVERSLLADHLKAERGAVARHLSDIYDLIPPDVERINYLFKTALKGSALEAATSTVTEAIDRLTTPAESRPARAPMGFRGASGSAFAPATPPPAAKPMAEKRDDRARAGEEAEGLSDMDADRAIKKLESKAGKDSKGYFADDTTKRAEVRQLYSKLDKTEEWVENNYYHLPIDAQNGGLVTVNALWRDFARFDGAGQFLSTNLAEGSRNFTEMMFALSAADLPFEAKKHESDLKDISLSLTPGSAMVVYHKEIREAPQADEKTPILVSQNFFRASDRYTFVNNERMDKYVTDEFLAHVVYGCQVVITNPTSSQQKLDILLQIPRGAMPVQNGFYTRGVHVELQSYNTTTVEYYFYFPAPGQFAHYPVHVAKNEKLIAFAAPVTLNVVEEPSKVDTTSWDYISQNGTDDQVIEFLKAQNVNRLRLDRIAWRMKDAPFFKTTTQLLAARHVYDQTLWSYGVKHDDLGTMREYLRHCDAFVSQCGAYLDSKPLTIDPVERRAYEHMEYSPLVNARAHRLGKKNVIVNDRFYAQYERLMNVLAYRPQLDDDDLMAVTYYLLLQDRVEEASAFFGKVNPAKLQTTIQHDYFRAYLDFYTDTHVQARAIALKYAQFPVDRWRNAFANVTAQLDEIDGRGPKVLDKEDRTQLQTELAAGEASFDFKVESKQVTLACQNVSQFRVNYYLMDIELLFSRNPFVQEYSGQFAYIKPNDSAVMTVPAGLAKYAFALPAKYFSSNVMVEIEVGGVKKSRAYFSNSLACQVIEGYGQVRVTDEASGRPLPKVYVKVYARLRDGRVDFYKDGYTDLRGRFDYTSLNTNELDNVEKFSILVMSESNGAVVKEANPPKR